METPLNYGINSIASVTKQRHSINYIKCIQTFCAWTNLHSDQARIQNNSCSMNLHNLYPDINYFSVRGWERRRNNKNNIRNDNLNI